MSKKRKKPKMEFRYYQMPSGSPMLALLGEKWVQNYGRDIDYLHFHNYLEIGFCYEGQGTLTLGEEDVRFSGREFSVIPRNYPHTTNSDWNTMSRWEYLFIDVEGFLHKMSDNPLRAEKLIRRINSRALFLKEAEHGTIAAKILRIFDIMRTSEEFYLEEACGSLLSLLAEIARINRPSDEKEIEERGRATNIISKALDYVSSHYMEDTKVEDIARYCHMSETHFRRLFSDYMHMGPLEYINTVRVQAACEHLRKTDESVADIAHKCGFTTNSTFNRNFRQIMGTTPMEWRKKPEHYERQLLKFDIHSEEGW